MLCINLSLACESLKRRPPFLLRLGASTLSQMASFTPLEPSFFLVQYSDLWRNFVPCCFSMGIYGRVLSFAISRPCVLCKALAKGLFGFSDISFVTASIRALDCIDKVRTLLLWGAVLHMDELVTKGICWLEGGYNARQFKGLFLFSRPVPGRKGW